MAESGLELGVNILFLINLISKWVESVTIGSVIIDEIHGYSVDAILQSIAIRQVYRSVFEATLISLTNFDSVNLQIFDMSTIIIQKKRLVFLRHFLEFERHHDLSKESFTLWHSHQHLIIDFLDQFVSLNRLILSQLINLVFGQALWKGR